MDAPEIPEFIFRRLKENLRNAEIVISDADLDGMIERGFLQVPIAFEEAIKSIPDDPVPDYLDDPGTVLAATALPSQVQESNGSQQGMSIEKFSLLIKSREVSPVELANSALARIAERDSVLNVYQCVLAESARKDALKAESEILAGRYRGPLHGIPVAVKDLMAMNGTVTTAGSKIFESRKTDFDSAVVERLRESGAVIVGKTRMSEFAYSPGSNNTHYGPTRNPRNPDHDTGGSSSGSAASVADDHVFAAIGTDTGGSIRIPSSQCGIVGLKPTFGRVSLYGCDTLSWSLDHAGPMTHTVRDAAILLEAIAGYDQRDPRTRAVPLTGLDQIEMGGRGLRIGVLREDGTGKPLADPDSLRIWNNALGILKQTGAELIDLNLPDFNTLRVLNSSIIAMEAASYHQTMLSRRLNDYGDFMRRRVLAAFAFTPISFVRANQARAFLRKRMNSIFDRVDLLTTPAMPSGAPLLGTPASTALSGPFNLLGWPAISVPAGNTSAGLPVGVQFAAKPWDEAVVLRAARTLELNHPNNPRSKE